MSPRQAPVEPEAVTTSTDRGPKIPVLIAMKKNSVEGPDSADYVVDQ